MSTKKPTPDPNSLMHDILDLYQGLLIPYMKVRRDMPFPTEPERKETDGEHAFMLAMVAVTVAEKMKLKLDRGKIAQYALIHDLVEAHAGDVSARSSEEEQQVKVNREQEAFLVIKKRYAKKIPWIPKLIEAYEHHSDEEATFVYALDKQMGSYSWLSGNGEGWFDDYHEEDGSTYHRVLRRLRKKASVYPNLQPLFDEVHAELDKRRVTFKK